MVPTSRFSIHIGLKGADEKMVDGKLVVRFGRAGSTSGSVLPARVTSADGNVAGLLRQHFNSFQGRGEEHSCDVLSAFTDEQGNFEADYLPGATYCICIDDARFVSNIIDLIPYESTTGKTNGPSLYVSPRATGRNRRHRGPGKTPIAHQYINLETPHEYSWRKTGKHGTASAAAGGRSRPTSKARQHVCPARQRDRGISLLSRVAVTGIGQSQIRRRHQA